MSRARDNEAAICDFTDKKTRISEYCDYMLNRINHLFDYEGLPENISRRYMELELMKTGQLCICRVEEDEILQPEGIKKLEPGVYCFFATPGGPYDFNQEPTTMIVAHPYLKQSKQLKIGEDCVLLRNDSLCMGLMPLFERYATMLVENDITINLADIQSRMTALITAGDDETAISAKQFLNDIKNGKLGIITDDGIDELFKLQVLPYSNTSNQTITNLIELEQYIKASWLNDLGLSSNYNMKREAINSSEAQLGQDALIPLIDDMLHSRQEAWDLANKLFGLSVSVDYHGVWKGLEEAITEPLETETETVDKPEEPEEEPETEEEVIEDSEPDTEQEEEESEDETDKDN